MLDSIKHHIQGHDPPLLEYCPVYSGATAQQNHIRISTTSMRGLHYCWDDLLDGRSVVQQVLTRLSCII